MSPVARILFVVSSDLYVRNYLRSGVVESIRNTHTVDVTCAENLELRDEVAQDSAFSGTYSVPRAVELRRLFFFHVLMWRFRKRSKTFRYRWQRMAGWGLFPVETTAIKRFLRALRLALFLLRKPRPIWLMLCGSRILFPITAWLYDSSEKITPGLRKLVPRGRYDAVVFPSAAFETVIPDLVLAAREAGIPSVSLIDNWDNLTSKTVYWHKPDYLAVWGEQAKNQAVAIHDFEPKVVHPIGTPRFDSYFLLRDDRNVEKIYEFSYILFVGSALPFDELAALHSLEETVNTAPGFPEDLKIVYRPHPWQQKRLVAARFHEHEFSRTILDTQIREAYSRGVKAETTHTSFQPDLSYYPRLLSHASIVVGPLTTMLFEAALCLKPVVALAYPDGHHFTTNRRYLSHFNGLENVPGFIFCDSPEDLTAAVLSAIQNRDISARASDDVTQFFLHRDQDTYANRLSGLLEKVTQLQQTNGV